MEAAGKPMEATGKPNDEAAKPAATKTQPAPAKTQPTPAGARPAGAPDRSAQAGNDLAAATNQPADAVTKPRPTPAEAHIAEQRVVDDRAGGSGDAPQARPDKPQNPAKDRKPRTVPSARLSGYQAEAAKLLAGAMPSRRKRRTAPDKPTTDPVAEDQAGRSARPARKGQSRPSAND